MFSLFLILFCTIIGNMPPDYNDTNVEDLSALIQRLQAEDPDLYAIAQNETTGGQNLNHKPVKAGLNKGHTAGGAWGMMPITAQEIVKRQFQQQYPDILEATPERITEILNNDPGTAYALAKAEYDRRLKLMGGDKSRTAYSWLNGVAGTKKATPEQIENHEYVQKFLKNLPTKVAKD
jgi:hypothetical protein